MVDRKEYNKAWYESHKEYHKAWRDSHKEKVKASNKAYRDSHREERKAYRDSHKEEMKAYCQAHKAERNARMKAYIKDDVNSLGQAKNNIRSKSRRILKCMNLHIDGYEVHHCFGYEDANKFIYISKSLHLKIHKFLRENNIPADSNHWMTIRDIVNSVDEFTYIKC